MKIRRFQERLKEKKIDIALIYNIDSMGSDNDLVYFTGYKGVGALVIPKDKPAFVLVPGMEYGRIKGKGIRVYKLRKKKRLFEEIIDRLDKNKIKNKVIGINKNTVTLNVHKAMKRYFKKSKYKDIYASCEKVREVKEDNEISDIKKACTLTDRLFSEIVKNLKNKKIKTELDIVRFMELKAKGWDSNLSFPPVVASGKGASTAHYEAMDVRLREGFLVMDFGVKYKDYNSDMTRTVYIGKPSRKDIVLYNLVLNIQKNTIQNIKLGDNAGKIYDNVLKDLGEYKDYFNHGLGHGIGIKVHELPNITLDSKDKIKKDMIFTIEPGIYFEDKLGIRIEDTIIMKDKAVRLTNSTKDLIIIS